MEVSTTNYHFAGWATCPNVLCSDGRTIMPDAFAHQDGEIVPLVWNHQHNDVHNVLGSALLHSRDGGLYTYCLFNTTESGATAQKLVDEGNVCSLSICANQLKHNDRRGVTHGMIREVSLVLSGANPGAFIDDVVKHGDEWVESEDEAIIYSGREIELFHADQNNEKEGDTVSEEAKKNEQQDDKTVEDVLNTLNEEQKTAVYYMLSTALEDEDSDVEDGDDNKDEEVEHSEELEHSEGGNVMKKNLFDKTEETQNVTVLTHADQMSILEMAKKPGCGSLREAMKAFAEDNELEHGFVEGTEGLEALLPDYKNLTPGAPEIIRPDQSWVMSVINKIHKSPYSRIRTRQADARIAELKAKGYKKGEQKQLTENIKLIGRSFDPQTVYIRDEVHRDDVIDITDFDYVAYIWNLMKDNMYETLALAALVGDGREDTDNDKIKEDHIRSVWHDDELYTIHRDVDIEKARQELQGTNTGANFSENYIYAEAIIMEALYAREKFKGSGRPDLYCAPHLVNVMLLARDLNGRRIYDSKADLAKALNVNEIHEIEQFEGLTREDAEGNTKKLLGLFVNLADYQFGSTKGGEITKFTDFDINFNKHQYLMETRLSGALTKLFSAIALEELVTAAG